MRLTDDNLNANTQLHQNDIQPSGCLLQVYFASDAHYISLRESDCLTGMPVTFLVLGSKQPMINLSITV